MTSRPACDRAGTASARTVVLAHAASYELLAIVPVVAVRAWLPARLPRQFEVAVGEAYGYLARQASIQHRQLKVEDNAARWSWMICLNRALRGGSKSSTGARAVSCAAPSWLV